MITNGKTRVALWGGIMFLAVVFAGAGCKKKQPFGADCKDDMECQSLSCSPFGNVCSKSCTVDKDCGDPTFVCRADDKDFNICSKPIGNPPNGSCMMPADCDHGHCLHRVGQEDQPGICSALCNTPDDCPVAGMKICESISDSAGTKYCLPGDPTAPPATRPQFGPAKKKGVAATTPPAGGIKINIPAAKATATAAVVTPPPAIVPKKK